ncbi:unnamed protein product, partial [Durusdinium trenchii]
MSQRMRRLKYGCGRPGDRMSLEEVDDQDKCRSMSRRSRRSLTQDMEKLAKTAKVSEVYSPPRMGPIAKKKEEGTAFDLATGWDLGDPAQVKRMWQTLQEEDPELVMLGNGDEAWFLFEHPKGAKSWHEAEVKEVEQLEGVQVVECDMCMFGLRVRHGLNKKPTWLMTNCEEIAREMRRKCDHSHFHEPPEAEGLTRKAQEYTKDFCEAVIQGLRKALKAKKRVEECFMGEHDEEDDDLEEALERRLVEEVDKEPRPGEDAPSYEPTPHEKQMVMKLHRGVGHPQINELVRLMRAARVRGEIVRWTAKHFKCEACAANPEPKAVRPVAIPRTYQPCKVIGMDLIFIPEVGGGSAFPALSIVDWGTNYQMVEKVLAVDAGKEFSSRMMNLAASHGIVTHQIAARAPWQQGKTERHGAHYKDLLEKARAEAVASSEDELRRLMQEVEMVKNRFSNRLQLVTDDMERQLERRRVAQKAFVEHNETVKKAFRARSRPPQEFSAGDYVYVYRVPHQRKRRVGGPDFVDRATAKPYWVGPGTVISIEGASLWISMFGELWKTAREQCIEVIMQDCKELLEEYRKRSNRAGFKDLTQEPWPEEEEQDGERHGVKRSREAEVDEQGGNPASEGGEEAHIGGQLMSQKKSALKKKELIGGNLWKKGHDEILALASAQSDEQLRGCLAIVGAESLFDYLSRETIGGQDRRTAIE